MSSGTRSVVLFLQLPLSSCVVRNACTYLSFVCNYVCATLQYNLHTYIHQNTRSTVYVCIVYCIRMYVHVHYTAIHSIILYFMYIYTYVHTNFIIGVCIRECASSKTYFNQIAKFVCVCVVHMRTCVHA